VVRGGAGFSGTGAIQLVPSPLATKPDPSAMTQKGPLTQVIVGMIGSPFAPAVGAGK